MKKSTVLIACLLVSLIGVSLGFHFANVYYKTTNHYAENRILLIHGNNVSCTGTEVIAPSGKVLTLTAGHCTGLIIDNKIGYVDAFSKEGALSVIAVDKNLDLMLLEGTTKQLGFDVAGGLSVDAKVYTMSHGWAMPAYKTEGEVLSTTLQPDAPVCEQTVKIQGFTLSVGCQALPNRTASTAWVLPGSSGGPLLDKSGDLVGITYALSGPFSYSVSLSDIKKFLKGH